MNSNAHQCCRWGRLDRGALAACGLIIGALVGGGAQGLGATALPAPPAGDGFHPQLTISVYQPVAVRDPFLKPGASNLPAGLKTANPSLWHLDGFLGSTNDLTAIVNGLPLSLNKPVMLETASGRIQIKAVTITLMGVVLEVDGKRLELKRAADPQPVSGTGSESAAPNHGPTPFGTPDRSSPSP